MHTFQKHIALSSIFLITLLIYWQGTSGMFLLDDIPVLTAISQYDYLGTWRNGLLFLLNGNAGPTGRPISLFSFFLNTQVWPAPPEPLIISNVFI